MTAETIAGALGGHRAGATWMARCPVHEDRSPSLSISAGKDGKVLVRCHAGCDQRYLIAALQERGLWQATGRASRIAFNHRGRIAEEPDADTLKRSAAALAIWQASHAAEGTPVATYLRSRGLDLPASPALRFHDGLKHPSGGVWPAMVALVTHGATGSPIAIHRTFLARDGGGKAPFDPAKMMLGPCRGGVVRLGEPADVLMVGEGIETCLAAMQATGTKGRIIVRGKLVTRGKAKKADFVLYYKPNIPIALIEAKDNNHSVGHGIQQGLDYAATLDIPFVFSSNGDSFVFHDRTGASVPIETNLGLDAFPSPADLWARYRAWKGLDAQAEQIVLQDYFDDGSGKAPRYYQVNAVNAAIEAIAKGRDRVLLVMATGTGKTYTAFQIIWRLWKAGRKKRILFLADRNVLIDQTMVNDFRPFGAAMAKLSTNAKTIENSDGTETNLPLALDRKRRIDTSFEVYLGLYQAITGPEERQKLFREFSPGFFDLIVIDECHRGSAADDSAWREILTHFSGATQIGLTATPKETEYVSNTDYFGEPVFTYSLKQGISDGFLAPYKVIKVHIDRDVEGYRPELGQLDRDGNEVEDRIYNAKDFDRHIVLDDRTVLTAKKITEFLKESGDRFQKTIVFCVDQEHAARMRQALVNENADLVAENARYVMRITGSDKEGQDQLGNFIDPESKYPVLVTTSRLLSTGVDAQTCRLIVLDRAVGSMTEFKQIVGRGTRVHEDTKKFYFTLIDFRGATSHFADPDFDGDPVQIYTPGDGDPITPPEDTPQGDDTIPPTPGADETVVDQPGLPLPPGGPIRKIYVDGVGARILAERVEYLDENGKLVTESLRDFTKTALKKRFASLDDFLKRWKLAERKQAIIEELETEGLALDAIADELGKNLDPFDLICHVAFDKKPLTRRERAENVKKRDVFTKYGPQARAVLDALLEKYRDEGVLNLDDANVLKVTPFTAMGSVLQLIKAFGGKAGFAKAVHELQDALYQESA